MIDSIDADRAGPELGLALVGLPRSVDHRVPPGIVGCLQLLDRDVLGAVLVELGEPASMTTGVAGTAAIGAAVWRARCIGLEYTASIDSDERYWARCSA